MKPKRRPPMIVYRAIKTPERAAKGTEPKKDRKEQETIPVGITNEDYNNSWRMSI